MRLRHACTTLVMSTHTGRCSCAHPVLAQAYSAPCVHARADEGASNDMHWVRDQMKVCLER